MKRGFPTLFEMIFRECECKGIKQNEIARTLKVDDSSVSRWRKGDVNIPFSRFIELCYIIRLSPSDMLEKWEKTEEFKNLDRRREHYHKIIDDALKLEYGLEVDNIMECLRAKLDSDLNKRRSIASKKVKRWVEPSGNGPGL